MEPEIREYHFHIYWFLDDQTTKEQAMELRNKILELNKTKLVAVPLETVNHEPRGPHPIGSYEVWVPCESFAFMYSFFILNRPSNISILLHPLTREELRDHTERAVFLGANVPLKVSALEISLNKVPAQYPELGLGYSK